MKKRVIWVIVLALISAYGLLSWVQYQYYDRILTLRKENMRSQMKDALSEVAEELQVRELVRYLNKGVGSKDAPLLLLLTLPHSISGLGRRPIR